MSPIEPPEGLPPGGFWDVLLDDIPIEDLPDGILLDQAAAGDEDAKAEVLRRARAKFDGTEETAE